MPLSPKEDIAWYLSTGEHDGLYTAWPGDNLIARAQNGELALRRALISAVQYRAPAAKVPDALADLDVEAALLLCLRAFSSQRGGLSARTEGESHSA